MPNDKIPEKPRDEVTPEKKQAPCASPEKYPKDEQKAESAPQWAIELGAKIDKLADAIIRSAAKPDEVKPPEDLKPKDEKKADAYPVPPEEKKPKDQAGKADPKAEPEKYPYGQGPDEQKFKTMIEDAIKGANIPEVVKSEISKRLVEEPIEKRARAPGPNSDKEETFEEFGKLSWEEIHKRAQKLGA
jgi:nucleotide-binding universal stress UspA family protein